MDFDKDLNLHESEWRRADKKEPIFGHGAFWFFNVTLPTILITVAFAYGFNFILSALIPSPFVR